ncbi:unnamed protein product [Prunus armeniaca]|uniref:Uncharacterized protein n=1 Tax=Prunus armeniaca TaxID=36596 RepID=A0A6J5Y6Q9_PRUAR|nr:unnamed protein product [Prunus armeniaca]
MKPHRLSVSLYLSLNLLYVGAVSNLSIASLMGYGLFVLPSPQRSMTSVVCVSLFF